MSKSFKFLTSFVLSLVLLSIVAIPVLADGPDEVTNSITPKIEIQKDGWLIISYSEDVKDKVATARVLDAYIAAALEKMKPAGGGGTRGSGYMQDTEQSNTGNSYVSAWFGTNASWSSSPASFWGSSSCAWYGTSPVSNINIGTEHILTPDEYISYITAVPGGWSNYSYYATSGLYTAYNNWYLGTSWSGLRASYPYSTYIDQRTTGAFDFPYPYDSSDRTLYPSNSVTFGY
jgi:hypothetical protein